MYKCLFHTNFVLQDYKGKISKRVMDGKVNFHLFLPRRKWPLIKINKLNLLWCPIQFLIFGKVNSKCCSNFTITQEKQSDFIYVVRVKQSIKQWTGIYCKVTHPLLLYRKSRNKIPFKQKSFIFICDTKTYLYEKSIYLFNIYLGLNLLITAY